MSAAEEVDVRNAVASARTGGEQGWNWIFDRFHLLVRRYVAARLNDQSAVDDVAQEVFVAAVRSISTLRGETSAAVEGWLLGIARHKVVDRVRANSRPIANPAPVSDPDPADVVVRRVEAEALGRLLEGLSEDQRDVLVRRFVLDQSLQHVAATTRRRVGAVKSLQHRGLAALARALAKEAL